MDSKAVQPPFFPRRGRPSVRPKPDGLPVRVPAASSTLAEARVASVASTRISQPGWPKPLRTRCPIVLPQSVLASRSQRSRRVTSSGSRSLAEAQECNAWGGPISSDPMAEAGRFVRIGGPFSGLRSRGCAGAVGNIGLGLSRPVPFADVLPRIAPEVSCPLGEPGESPTLSRFFLRQRSLREEQQIGRAHV